MSANILLLGSTDQIDSLFEAIDDDIAIVSLYGKFAYQILFSEPAKKHKKADGSQSHRQDKFVLLAPEDNILRLCAAINEYITVKKLLHSKIHSAKIEAYFHVLQMNCIEPDHIPLNLSNLQIMGKPLFPPSSSERTFEELVNNFLALLSSPIVRVSLNINTPIKLDVTYGNKSSLFIEASLEKTILIKLKNVEYRTHKKSELTLKKILNRLKIDPDTASLIKKYYIKKYSYIDREIFSTIDSAIILALFFNGAFITSLNTKEREPDSEELAKSINSLLKLDEIIKLTEVFYNYLTLNQHGEFDPKLWIQIYTKIMFANEPVNIQQVTQFLCTLYEVLVLYDTLTNPPPSISSCDATPTAPEAPELSQWVTHSFLGDTPNTPPPLPSHDDELTEEEEPPPDPVEGEALMEPT